jgi:hypothetical protein
MVGYRLYAVSKSLVSISDKCYTYDEQFHESMIPDNVDGYPRLIIEDARAHCDHNNHLIKFPEVLILIPAALEYRKLTPQQKYTKPDSTRSRRILSTGDSPIFVRKGLTPFRYFLSTHKPVINTM